MTNSRRTLYIGMTNDILRRVEEHKMGSVKGYSSLYNLNKLVHLEEFATAIEAIAREKQLKGWLRARKELLIEETNSLWQDLAKGWFEPKLLEQLADRADELKK